MNIIYLRTDIAGNYFISGTEYNSKCPQLEDVLKDEIANMGLLDVFEFRIRFNFEPCKHYKCKMIFEENRDYYGNLIDSVPTIIEIKEINNV